jgi:hypothetical protein
MAQSDFAIAQVDGIINRFAANGWADPRAQTAADRSTAADYSDAAAEQRKQRTR